MARYPINDSPPIADGGTMAFTEVRICLDCPKVPAVTSTCCPSCMNISHTRTFLITHMRSVDDYPRLRSGISAMTDVVIDYLV